MKRATSYVRAVQALGKIFDAANEEYCQGRLEKPTITIQSSLKAYAHVSISKVWKTSEGKESRELNVSAEYLMRDNDFESVVASVLHEMAHIYAADIAKVRDTSNGNYFHNKNFKRIAEEVFHLEIEKDPSGRYGWTRTNYTLDTIELVEKYQLKPILINRDGGMTYTPKGTPKAGSTGTPKVKPKGSNSIKWTCPCGTIIRSTKEVNVFCGDCGCKFEKA